MKTSAITPKTERSSDMKKKKCGQAVFAVAIGSGEFPPDMLRYDSCWPAFESQAIDLRHHTELGAIILARSACANGTWTPERWRGFGWRLEVLYGVDSKEQAMHDAKTIVANLGMEVLAW
jgi:hypothetical protein